MTSDVSPQPGSEIVSDSVPINSGRELLKAADVAVNYGLRPVLRGLDVTMFVGDFIALLGPNGAGKTTLLRVLATLLRPARGTLKFGVIDALAQPERARKKIGVVSHASMLYGDLTAREYLLFHAHLHGQAGHIASRLVATWLTRVGLVRRADDRIRRFSRGMQQRLTLARALLHGPQLLLLDEPYTGLDAASADTLNSILVEFTSSGGALIMSTHEIERGMSGVNRVLTLVDGNLAEGQRAE